MAKTSIPTQNTKDFHSGSEIMLKVTFTLIYMLKSHEQYHFPWNKAKSKWRVSTQWVHLKITTPHTAQSLSRATLCELLRIGHLYSVCACVVSFGHTQHVQIVYLISTRTIPNYAALSSSAWKYPIFWTFCDQPELLHREGIPCVARHTFQKTQHLNSNLRHSKGCVW